MSVLVHVYRIAESWSCLLVEVGSAASLFNARLSSVGKLPDMAVHRVLGVVD